MDQEMQDKIDKVEQECRDSIKVLRFPHLSPYDILDIFAAFRLEIIKAGGRNA